MTYAIKQYAVVTLSYWGFTLTDGALRMLVILYFHQLGYSPLEVASVFLLYELCGVFTNLLGGWLASYIGLNTAMHLGLSLQIIALSLLLVPAEMLTVVYVMWVQALSGMGKDLNKMSAKSSLKLLVPDAAQGRLYQWVAFLTGSKNTLKGVGFFMGAFLLDVLGFQIALISMAVGLMVLLLLSYLYLDNSLGKLAVKAHFSSLFSHSEAINRLSLARLFLFGARDIWFVIALPMYLQVSLNWSHTEVGVFLALWVIGYGMVQAATPFMTGFKKSLPDGQTALFSSLLLSLIPATMAWLIFEQWHIEAVLLIGLCLFGGVFAINSALHSYLIVAYASHDEVSVKVGFYYMANALGRLVGTILSGWVYQISGLVACLIITTVFIIITSLISIGLPRMENNRHFSV